MGRGREGGITDRRRRKGNERKWKRRERWNGWINRNRKKIEEKVIEREEDEKENGKKERREW